MELANIITLSIQTIGLVGGGIYIYTNIRRDIEDVKKEIKKINNIESTLIDVTSFIKELSTHMYDGDFRVPSSLKKFNKLYKSASPVKLTKEGKEFLKNIGFMEIYNKNKDTFLFSIKDKLQDKKDDLDFFYFAEKYSLVTIHELYEKESHLLSSLREYMFSIGKSDKKDIFLNAIGYFLRDEIIETFGKTEEFNTIKNKDKKNIK